MQDYTLARMNMVKSQVRTNRVTNPRVVAALSEIPREQFVPGRLKDIAYIDEDLEIAPGRHLMEPMVFARLLEEMRIAGDELALVVGAATGYSTAVLGKLCNTVVGVESDAELAAKAGETLARLGIDNAAVVEGSLRDGYPKQGPYDIILFDGAVARVPEAIERQLAEGGRMAAVVEAEGVGRAHIHVRVASVVSGRPVFDAATPILPGFEPEAGFVF